MTHNIHSHAHAVENHSQPTPPPYIVFYITTTEGRLFQVNGEGFTARDIAGATRHPVALEIKQIDLLETSSGQCNVNCIAPLQIMGVSTAKGRMRCASKSGPMITAMSLPSPTNFVISWNRPALACTATVSR